MPTGIYMRKPLSLYKVDKISGCWNYTGKLQKNGYGEHRYYYQRITGKQIPNGMTLDHLCRNKICVNPEHLEVVTLAENKRRASKLSYGIVENVKRMYSRGIKQCEIGKIFRIHQCHVSRIINNLRWN